MLLTAKDFNEKYSNIQLYKVLSEDYIHNNFEYKNSLYIIYFLFIRIILFPNQKRKSEIIVHFLVCFQNN